MQKTKPSNQAELQIQMVELLSELDELFPGHGIEIENPIETVSWYLFINLAMTRQLIKQYSTTDKTFEWANE